MTTRLYEDFMKKLKVPPIKRFKKNEGSNELVIAIPLKGGTGVRK